MNKLILFALLGCFLSFSGNTSASDELHQYLRDMSYQIAGFLKDKKENKIVITYSGPPNFRNSSAEAFIQLLSEKLKDRNIDVVDQASFAFVGQYQVVTGTPARLKAEAFSARAANKTEKAIQDFEKRFQDLEKTDTNKRMALKLTGKMTDILGETVGPDFDALISEKLLASTLGLSVNYSGGLGGPGRTNAIQNAIRSPSLSATEDGVVRAGLGSPYTVEIFVEDKIRKVELRDGLGYIPIGLGEEYKIQFGNFTRTDVVVELKIDGLNSYHLCEKRAKDSKSKSDPPAYRYYYLVAGQKGTAQGWFINEKESLAFRITPLKESVAFQTGKTSKIGMITATFHASWKSNERPPVDEPSQAPVEYDSAKGMPIDTRMLLGGSQTGTGAGTKIQTDVQAVGGERRTGVERATITLRYERPKN